MYTQRTVYLFPDDTAKGKSKDQAIKLGKRVCKKQNFTQKITLL